MEARRHGSPAVRNSGLVATSISALPSVKSNAGHIDTLAVERALEHLRATVERSLGLRMTPIAAEQPS